MCAAVLPIRSGHAGFLHSSVNSNNLNLSPAGQLNLDVGAVINQPHRTTPASHSTSRSTSPATPASASSLQLPTLHITNISTTSSPQQIRLAAEQNQYSQSNQKHHLQLPRPSSFIHQQRRTSYHDRQPATVDHRLSWQPQPNTTRPISQIIPTQDSASSRLSTISTASFSDTLVGSPQTMTSQYMNHNVYPSHPPPMNNMSRRTPSNASNTSSQHESIRRSSSSRSSNVSSYVALLRKQKATVWCDRSQAEDPRIMAAQRLAKERAERAVSALPSQTSQAHQLQGSNGNNGTSGPGGAKRTPPSSNTSSFTTGVARKIRHHGAQKATTYAGGNMAGAGVPLRLIATEIDDDEEDEGAGERLGSLRNPMDDMDWDAQFYGAGPIRGLHARSASGQSRSNYPPTSSLGAGKLDIANSTPPSLSPDDDMTPGNSRSKDYFTKKNSNASTTAASAAAAVSAADQAKEDELRRRGSVDERAMTLSGVRLFVANPDMDSD